MGKWEMESNLRSMTIFLLMAPKINLARGIVQSIVSCLNQKEQVSRKVNGKNTGHCQKCPINQLIWQVSGSVCSFPDWQSLHSLVPTLVL